MHVAMVVDHEAMARGRASRHVFIDGHERSIRASLRRRRHTITVIPVSGLLGDLERELKSTNPDVVFNLTEQYGGSRRFDATIADLIEASGFRMTGSTGACLRLCRDKGASKAVLADAGITVPRYAAVHDLGKSWRRVTDSLTLPVVVKPLALDGSDLISRRSLCYSWRAAKNRARWLLREQQEAAIIEEYIRGWELAMPVTRFSNTKAWRPRVLRIPSGYTLDPIATVDVKDRKRARTPQPQFVTPRISRSALRAASEVATRAVSALGIGSYSRVDMIVRTDGVPVVMEVNANCCLLPRAFCISQGRTSIDYDRLIAGILAHTIAGTL